MEEKRTYHTLKKNASLAAVIKAHVEEQLPIRTIAEKFGLSKTTVHRWISNFVDDKHPSGRVTMKEKTHQEPKSINPEDMAKLTPEEQVAYLKEALRKAELRADAYDAMIDIAEKKFSIPIRKKAGVKQ